jgi:hypothetical protein
MLLVLLVAVVMITAGGLATASNTGFKINTNMPIAAGGEIGNTWLSIPYFNPYGNWNAFCTATGLVSTGLGARASIVFQDPVTGLPSASVNCGVAAGSTTLLPAGVGFRVRNAGPVGQPPTSIIIVGSHNPTTTFTVQNSAGGGQRGSSWFAVPYHTTAVTANDLCLSSGLTSSGLAGRANIIRFDAATGLPSPAGNCGTASASSITLQLGEAVRIREIVGVTRTFVPAHF